MMKERNKKGMKENNKKTMSIFQIIIMIVSTIAFVYLISLELFTSIPSVSADSPVPTSCCKETNDGATCQTINSADSEICKDSPVATSCDYTDGCQPGCCYNTQEGICSLNSPKDKCISTGGNWSNNAQCNIPQCQLGCCIFGEEASITTARECTLMSRDLELDPDFKPLDAFGSCSIYTGLSQKGACVVDSGDFSGENNCKFTTKGLCKSGSFYEGFLCTAPQLNTSCTKSKQTTCLPDKDQVYYLDSCNNTANVYDSSKYNDISYWTQIISPSSSCSPTSKDCGNCDYLSGSVCNSYREGKDTRPTYGNNVCRDLSCANGKKHGESWCVGDYNSELFGESPVGSRFFVGKCMDGEITIEPCADFNNQICIQTSGNSTLSEAKCIMNDWRSCIAANDKSTYSAIKQECDSYDQCIMFNEIPGNEKYAALPGFLDNLSNEEQGAAGEIGKGINKVIPYCVPKYTPGMVFWNTKNPVGNNSGSSTTTQSNSNNQIASTNTNYGGSLAETQAICSLGSFTCTSHKTRKCVSSSMDFISAPICATTFGVSALVGNPDCSEWEDVENWECNIDASNPNANSTVQLTLEALNERCRSLGPCGGSVNIAGELGNNAINNSIKRSKTSASGSNEKISIAGYEFSEEYISNLKSKPQIVQAGSLKTLLSALALALITGRTITENSTTAADAIAQENAQNEQQNQQISQLGGVVSTGAGLGLKSLPSTGSAVTSAVSSLNTGTVVATGHSVGQSGLDAISLGTTPVANTLAVGGTLTESLGTFTAGATGVAGNVIGTTGGITITAGAGGATVGGASIAAGQSLTALPGASFTASAGSTISSAGGGIAKITGGATLSKSSSFIANLKTAGYQIVGAAIGMAAGYMIGKLILKNQNWSPGRAGQFMSGIMAFGSAVGTIGATVIVAVAGGCSNPITCIPAVVIALLISIYTNCVDNSYHENEYYTMQYTCDAWQPPLKGDCSLCNNDIRTCSEYRCKSLGQNCQYFIDNGEPGYCASLNDIWSATIKPWPEALSSEHKYSDVKETSFKITGNSTELVDAWIPITFGIITDKYAKCKIDNKHTPNFESMAVDMITDVPAYSSQEAQNPEQGSYHKIALSPNLLGNQTSAGTLAFSPGENNYYIRCQNFAGQSNAAEFAVKIISDSGPDLTPPIVKSFFPSSSSYLKLGANSTALTMWVSEPSNCKYSQSYDLLYSDMNNTLTCLTSPSSGYLGSWPCYTVLNNLKAGENKFFFKCQDNPNSQNTSSTRKNTNENSKQYLINVCTTGLNITSLTPQNEIVTGKSPISLTLRLETSGCISEGKATCSYRFNDFGNSSQYIDFINTNSNTHTQVFTNMPDGNHSISIKCIDEAGNTDEKTMSVQVTLDDSAPIILRGYDINQKLTIITNENSQCGYTQNSSIGCTFNLNNSLGINLMVGNEKNHVVPWEDNKNYYIKCSDIFGNENNDCFTIKTY